jgi:hypothetical protein
VKSDTKDRYSRGYRLSLKCLIWCTLGVLVRSAGIVQPQEGQPSAVTKGTELKMEQAGCQDDSIIPNTKPQWKAGQTFRYHTAIAEAMQSGLPGVSRGGSGKVVLRNEPIPLQQAITVGENSRYKGEDSVVIEREGLMEPPAGHPLGAEATDQSKSYINAEGKIRYSESQTTTTDGQNTNVNKNRISEFAATSDLHYFYGYWMLALTPKFSWECVRDRPEGPVLQKLRVTRMETLDGRECFVVERTYRNESQGSQLTTYWIDKNQRIAILVKRGTHTIRLIS